MWRKVDIYNVFVLKTVDLLREAGKDIINPPSISTPTHTEHF